jgi:hypothetical protein
MFCKHPDLGINQFGAQPLTFLLEFFIFTVYGSAAIFVVRLLSQLAFFKPYLKYGILGSSVT